MTTRTCPICRKGTATAPYAPFCSKRCADVDLQRWFAGVYAVPAAEPEDVEEAMDEDKGA
jgi:endogenous inhibitor of DNA gyrase (YacG/DUF329 family)